MNLNNAMYLRLRLKKDLKEAKGRPKRDLIWS